MKYAFIRAHQTEFGVRANRCSCSSPSRPPCLKVKGQSVYKSRGTSIRESEGVRSRTEGVAHQLRAGDAPLLRALVASGKLLDRTLSITLDRAVLSHRLGVAPDSLAPQISSLEIPVRLKRRGVEMKLVGGTKMKTPDLVLKAALAKAHRWAREVKDGKSLRDVAGSEGQNEALVRTRTPLAFLSPKIQRAILDGTQPVDLTLERLVRQTLPLDWQDQERLCGF